MQRAHKVAEGYDKALLATDPRFSHVVRVVHEEGTSLFYVNAFLMKWKDPEVVEGAWGACETPGQWLFIFTEHHGFHVYPLDDLHSYREYVHADAPTWLQP
jgi:hypothetical protein